MPPIIDDRATTTTSAPRRGRIVDDTAAPEQPSGLRTAASIAVPMAMQVGAGLATAPLLAAGPAGVAAYGAANVGAGVAAERTRQAILGEEPNYKTAALTGALNVIPLPGVKQGASALGAIGRTGGAAAALGAGEEVGRAYLEDRPITLENLLASGAISGAVGGAMGGAAQGLANRRVAAPNPKQIQAVTPPDAPQPTGKGKIVDDIAPDGQGALPLGERPRGPVATWDAEGRKLVLGPDGKPVELQGDQQQIAEQNQAVTQLQPSAQLAADLAEIERLRAENARLKGEPPPKPSIEPNTQQNQQVTQTATMPDSGTEIVVLGDNPPPVTIPGQDRGVGQTFDLQRDGIVGAEVDPGRVPNGDPAFQYALGTPNGGQPSVYRRRADERGTYGGWRWETDVDKLRTDARTDSPLPAPIPEQNQQLATPEAGTLPAPAKPSLDADKAEIARLRAENESLRTGKPAPNLDQPAPAPAPVVDMAPVRELAQSNRLVREAVDLLERGGTPETRQPLTPESVIASLRDAVEFRGANPRAADDAIEEVALAFGLPPQQPLARPSKKKTLKEVLNPAPEVAPASNVTPSSRQIQGLSDEAIADEVSPEDVARFNRIQSRPAGKEFEAPDPEVDDEVHRFRLRLVQLDDLGRNDARTQPRTDRTLADDSLQQIEDILQKGVNIRKMYSGLDVVQGGGPIIGPDGLLEAGNGRVTAFVRMAAERPEKWAKFQAELREKASDLGFDLADFDKLENPNRAIIVRERVSRVPDRLEFGRKTNRGSALNPQAFDVAFGDAAALPDDFARGFTPTKGGTFADSLLAEENAPVVARYLDSLPQSERGGMFLDGELTQDGVKRVRAGMIAKLAGLSDDGKAFARAVLSAATDQGKRVQTAIEQNLGQLLQAKERANIDADGDIGPDLATAFRIARELRQKGTVTAADVDQRLRERMLDGSGVNDRAAMLTDVFLRAKSAQQLSAILRDYLDVVVKNPAKGQAGLFGGGVSVTYTDPTEALARAIVKNNDAEGKSSFFNRPKSKAGEGRGSLSEHVQGLIRKLAPTTLNDMLGNQKGGTPIFGDLARWLLGRGEPGGTQPTTQSRPLSDQAASRQQSLEREALPKVQGAAPAPNPAIEILDEFGRPIKPTGALSSDDPARLAPSMLGVDRDQPTGFNVGQIVAEDSSVDFGNARRNVQSWGQLDQAAQGVFLRLAARADESPETYWKSLRRRGETFNSETIVALGRWADDLDRKLATDSARALQSGDPEAIARVVDQLKGEYKGVRMQEAGAAAEAGRALQALRKVKAQREATQADIRRILASEGVSPEQLEEFMRAILAAGDDPIAVGKVRQAAQGGLWEQVVKYRMAFMLSGIKTHVANVGGNTGALGKRLLDRPAGGAIDAVRSTLTGTPRTRYMGEVLADIEGMTAPVRTANRKAIETFEKKKAAAAGSLWGQGEGAIEAARVWLRTLRDNPASLQSKFDSPVTYARTRIGRIAELPLRALRLEDDVFKSAAYYGDLHALAYRQAATEGVSGYRNRIARAREILAGPIPAEMIEAATQEALYRTFQGEAGDFTRRAMGLRNWAPLNGRIKPVELIVPFLRTPVKLGAFAAENSPLGALHLAWHAGQGNLGTGEIVDQAAKIATGTMAATAFFMLAKQGLIKGSGPSDPGEQRAWREAGNKPYTAYLGDDVGWVDYSRLDPVAMLIGTTADAAELSTVESDDALAKVGFAFGRNFLSKQYISGLADFLDAVQDPDRHAAKWSQGIAQSFTPAIVAHLGAAKDPYLREAGSMEETLRLRSPLQSDRAPVPIVRDIWGEPVTIAGGFVEKLISPFPRSRPKTDPASLEIARLGYAPGSPANALGITGTEWKGKIAMTPDEYERFVVLSGQRAKHYVNNLIQLPAYKALAGRDAEQAEQVAKQFSAARREVRQEMKAPLAERAARQGIINPQTFQMRVPDLRKRALR